MSCTTTTTLSSIVTSSGGREHRARLGVGEVLLAIVLGVVVPVPAEVLAGVGHARRRLRDHALVVRAEEVLTDPHAAAGPDEPGRGGVEVPAPPLLGVEERAVIGEDVLVDEDVALLAELGPQVQHA